MADQEGEATQSQEQEVTQEAQEETTEQGNENQSNEPAVEGGDSADGGQVIGLEQAQDVNENAGASEEVQGEAQEAEQTDAQLSEQVDTQETEQTEAQESEQAADTQEAEQAADTQEAEQAADTQESEQAAETQEAEQAAETQEAEQAAETQEAEQAAETQEAEQAADTQEAEQAADTKEAEQTDPQPSEQADTQEAEKTETTNGDEKEEKAAEEDQTAGDQSVQPEVSDEVTQDDSNKVTEGEEATAGEAGESEQQQSEEVPQDSAPQAEQTTEEGPDKGEEQAEAADKEQAEDKSPEQQAEGEQLDAQAEQAETADDQAGATEEQAETEEPKITVAVEEAPAQEEQSGEPETSAEVKAAEQSEPTDEQTGVAGEQEQAPPEEEQTAEATQQEVQVVQGEQEKTADEEPPSEKPPSPAMVETEVQEATSGQKEPLTPRKPVVNLEATATVKFVLMPSGQVVTLANTLGQTLGELKSHFASELKMPINLIMLMFDGKGMSESTTLAELGVGPNGTVQLEMQSADPVNNPLRPYRPRQEYHMPDVITVRVMTEDCEAKDVVVEIERSRSKKPFLGGFRNKNTGVEYHNASAQTMQKPRPPPTTERFCRDTQTCEQKNTRQQTTNTTSTQMTGINVYVSNAEDKLITPGKFFTADEYRAMILKNVIIMQKYYRRWLAKRYVTKLKEDKERRLEWERQEELRKKKEKEDRIKMDYARRINPKTKADFDMLLHCLEKWRQEEMERINATLTGAERKAAMCMLLDQETELLSAIERHKNEANDDNKDKRIMSFLDKAAAPKKWQGHDGNLTYMDTPYTIRAKELRDIYNSINMKYLTQDERLDVLLTLKHTVKEHDCKLTQEIIELIDREADLLMRGVKEGNLTGLRKRISTLFLQYIKTPTFNPEAAKLLKVPQDPSVLRKDINYCHSCGAYKPSTEFFITSNSKNVGRCRKCQKVENDGRQRHDHTYYKTMIKALRRSEEAMQDGSSICYLLQEHDLRYLVESIWGNQSVLSAWNDPYDLVLVRWNKHQEWSPWNCILLTHDEAEAHKKLFSLEEGYGDVFIHKVTQRHNFARNYFSRLPGMAEVLRQKVGSRELDTTPGPSVAGHAVPKAAQKV